MGPNPGEELGETERLDEVVVGTSFEADHDIELVAACRQNHEDDVGVIAAEPTADLDPVEVGEAQVEQHERRRSPRGRRQCHGSGGRVLDLVALGSQGVHEPCGDAGVVFHDEQVGRSSGRDGESLPGDDPDEGRR
jgi:hypothetical protein